VRPTGFFSFLLELLTFARHGYGVMIGDGSCKTNPIHEEDVARACVEALEANKPEMVVGGPDIFTRKETILLAFEALGKKPRLIKVSPAMFKLMITPLKLSNKRIHALLEFGVAVTQIDCVAPPYGTQHLKHYFEKHSKS
jgi:nucleoside-diphosphate-sugar epimerase